MLPPTDKSLNDAFFALVHTKSKMEREKVVIAKDREIVLSHLSRDFAMKNITKIDI